jgi:hypothetical protein
MINEHGVVDETIIGREREVFEEDMPQCHFTDHISHMS